MCRSKVFAAAALGLSIFSLGQFAAAQESPATQPSASIDKGTQIPASRSSGNTDADLTSLSLEDLMNVTVNSVSKADQPIAQAAAAVTVINQDDIARSGMLNIPELMRLAPGMDVAQLNASTWAISSRGYNSQFADKLLVLMDGRTIYDPLADGVFWNMQDYVLADLDKIEIIRGPGATLWGSNAVNGVINITTKSARDTQGLLIDGVGGTAESEGSIRYGGQIGSDTYYRVYGKFSDTQNLTDDTGTPFNDAWESSRGGFRMDRYLDSENILTVQGDVSSDTVSHPDSPPSARVAPYNSGTNLLARWSRDQSTDSGMSLQVYYDSVKMPVQSYNYSRDTVDADFKQRFPIGTQQELTWGLGARGEESVTDDVNYPLYLLGGQRKDFITSSFVQDDLTIIPDRLHVVGGSKFEYSSYDRFQAEPGARILYTPNQHNTVWGAVASAVRSPSLLDLAEVNPFGAIGAPGTVSVGNPGLKPEKELDYELGYRAQPIEQVTFDFAGFYNRYDQLTANTLLPDGNTIIVNAAHGWSYGAELSAEWKVTPTWRLQGAYTFLYSRAFADPGAVLDDNNTVAASPENQLQGHSYLDLMKNLQFNASAYYVDPTLGVSAYTRVDLGINWHACDAVDIGIEGQNLLQQRHLEFNGAEPISRSVYAYFKCSF